MDLVVFYDINMPLKGTFKVVIIELSQAVLLDYFVMKHHLNNTAQCMKVETIGSNLIPLTGVSIIPSS